MSQSRRDLDLKYRRRENFSASIQRLPVYSLTDIMFPLRLGLPSDL